MRELIIVFDSVPYYQFMLADAPNVKSVGEVRRAYSHGRWTRPSMASMLSGYLPQCEGFKNPWEPSWVYLDFGEEPRYFFNTSPWCRRLHPTRGVCLHYDPPRQAPEIVEDMVKTSFGTAVVLFSETHLHYWFEEETEGDKVFSKEVWDYNQGKDVTYLPVKAMLRQREAIKYLDSLLKPLLDSFEGRVYVTSDHGELFGERHRIGHDPSFEFHKKLFEVPLVVGEV